MAVTNGNHNAKKQWYGWLNEDKNNNNRAARALRSFVNFFRSFFFDVVCYTMTWNLNIGGSDDNASPEQ